MNLIKPINKEELMDKGQEIYDKLKKQLLPEHKGDVIAIEVKSGDYFIGKDVDEAIEKAKDKHPDRIFCVLRIGHRALWRI